MQLWINTFLTEACMHILATAKTKSMGWVLSLPVVSTNSNQNIKKCKSVSNITSSRFIEDLQEWPWKFT